MKIITYEIGGHTLKISTAIANKTNAHFEDVEQIPFNHGLNIYDENFLTESINEIYQVHQTLKQRGKVIIVIPYFLTTSRNIGIPVGSKNKIKMMIPFQLDESLHSGSHQMHWIEQIYKVDKNYSNICLSIINKELFKTIPQQLVDLDFHPSLVTTELSVYLGLIENLKKTGRNLDKFPINTNENFVIMDMGEYQTKAYFFSSGQLVFNHFSNIGSYNIDENIADNYEISLEEAKVFKEENGFMFTSEDYHLADQDQKIFARLMEKTLETLIFDFTKWDLVFRSKTSSIISKCFIVGGMAKMANMEKFLTEHLEVKTELLSIPSFDDSIEYSNYFSHQSISHTLSQAGQIGNFLKDEFKLSSNSTGIADGTAFYFSRSFVLSLIIIFFLGIERIFIHLESSNVENAYKKALNSKALNLVKRDQLKYRNNIKGLNELIAPRLKIIDENKELLAKDYSIPYQSLYSHLTEIKSLKDIELSQVSLTEKKISSIIKIKNSEKYSEIEKNLQSKFGKNLRNLEANSQYEINMEY